MSLQFIGESGLYLADRDAVKITAVAGDSVVDVYVTRPALDAIGASARDPIELVRAFEKRRVECEIAAMVKFRRATARVLSLEITPEDLVLIDRTHAA